MHKNMIAALATAAIVGGLLSAGTSHAQAPNACANRIFVNSIWSEGSAPYDYYLQVQNRTNETRTVTITVDGFDQHPDRATLPYLAPITLRPHTVQTVKFGSGTRLAIDPGVVRVVWDQAASRSQRTIALNNCAVIP